jgi:hypothetical protein
LKYFLLRDKKGVIRSVGASAVADAGMKPGRGESVEMIEGPHLDGVKLFTYLRKLMGQSSSRRPAGKKAREQRQNRKA